MFAVFGVLAVLLAALGLYGVLAYTVTRRTHEIGVRVSLGAEVGDVRRLVVAQGVRLAAIGVLIGGAGALVGGRALGALLYGVSSSNMLVLGGSAAISLRSTPRSAASCLSCAIAWAKLSAIFSQKAALLMSRVAGSASASAFSIA